MMTDEQDTGPQPLTRTSEFVMSAVSAPPDTPVLFVKLSDGWLSLARLDDVERLQAGIKELERQNILLKVEAQGAGSLLLDVQRDCIEARRENAALREENRRLASLIDESVGEDVRCIAFEKLGELLEEIAALRELVQAVADAPMYHAVSGGLFPPGIKWATTIYTCDELVAKARALLQQTNGGALPTGV